MKKNYILFIALFAVIVSYGQTTRTFNGSTGATWSDAANWLSNEKPTTLAPWDEVTTAVDSDVDDPVTITTFTVTGSSDRTLTSSDDGLLTLDGNVDANTDGIVNALTIAGELTINATIDVNNSQASSRFTFFESTNGSTINFGASSDISANSRIIVDSDGIVNFAGEITGVDNSSRVRLYGSGTFNFDNAFSDMSVRYVQPFQDGATLNFNATTDIESFTNKTLIFQAGSASTTKNYELNLNAINSIQVQNINFNSYTETDVNVVENNEDLGTIRLITNAVVNLDIAADKKIGFTNSSGRIWTEGVSLNISGYDFSPLSGDPSNIRFGTTSGGLSEDQLSKIVLVGGANAGAIVALDTNGYLILNDPEFSLFKEFDNGANQSGTADGSWADATNWTEGYVPNTGQDYINVIANSTMDIPNLEIKRLTASGTEASVTVSKSGLNMLTIDTGATTNDDIALFNSLDTGGTLNFNGLLTVNNDNDVRVRFSNNTASNTLQFGSDSEVSTNVDLDIDNDADVVFDGVFTETVSGQMLRLSGNGDFTFNSDLGLFDVSTVEINNHPTGGGTTDFNFSDGVDNDKLLNINGSGNVNEFTINLNAENTLNVREVNLERNVDVDFNVVESQDNIGILDLSDTSILNVDISSGKSCAFSASDGAGWDATATIAITGFVQDEGVTPNTSNVRFGTDENGLSVTQLSQITVNGDAASISSAGYIVRANSLSVTNVNAIDFAIYPNPVVDVLTITSAENIAKYEVLNLVGTTVVSVFSIENGLDVSNLTSGVYILRLTSANGVSTAKFVKK